MREMSRDLRWGGSRAVPLSAANMPGWLSELLVIAILLVVIVVVVVRLPKPDLGHSQAFVRRRFMNWFPVGLTYAFLYMGRYNLTEAKNALGGVITNDDFGTIFLVGTWVYGCSFVLNGPLTDRWGGRTTILIAAIGAAVCNLAMGFVVQGFATGDHAVGVTVDEAARASAVTWLKLLYGANMYFQSFGAVSIVKVNAHWFHVRERGTFSGIFGILISLGLYFAYDWSRFIIGVSSVAWAFWVPAAILALFALLDWIFVFDYPSQAGQADLATGEASLSAEGEKLTVLDVAARLFKSRILVTIVVIEFCSGFFRQAVMQWGSVYAKSTGVRNTEFVHQHWGMMLCIAGILGGVVAGLVSDHLFHSRRGPSVVFFYGAMLGLTVASAFLLGSPVLGVCLVLMSMCIIGVHGLLSGTASMDFAGKRNTGLAVGIIDGFRWCILGGASQLYLPGFLLSLCVVALFLWLGVSYFRSTERTFADLI